MNPITFKVLEKEQEINTMNELKRRLREDLAKVPEPYAAELQAIIDMVESYREPVWGISPERHYVESYIAQLRTRLSQVQNTE